MARLHTFFSALADLVSHFVRWYDASLFGHLAKRAQSLGILIAIVALIYTLNEIREDRVLREATLITMFAEQIKAIEEIRKSGAEFEFSTHDIAREIIERMVSVGVELNWLQARNLKLNGANFRGANFANAQLMGVELIKADLSKANFTRSNLREAKLLMANLTEADFTEADLRNANFWKADFTGAVLTDANIGGAKLKNAVGVTQSQLDSTCFTSATGEQPPEISQGSQSHLHWKERECGRIYLP